MPFTWPMSMSLGTAVILVFTFIVIAIGTWFSAGGKHLSVILSGKHVRVPAIIPYMVPFLGHYAVFFYREPLHWIKQISSNMLYHQPFIIYIWGRNFYVSSKRGLMEAIFTTHGASLNFAPVRSYMLVNFFGAHTLRADTSSAAIEVALSSLKKHTGGENFSKFVNRLVKIIQEDGPNLVSFSESMVDENLWERLANPTVVSRRSDPEDNEVFLSVEVDMFALIRNFVGMMTMRALMGKDWADSQSNFVDLLWSFDNGFRSMVMGVPRWVPIPGLSKAYIARRRLCQILASFHRAMDSHATSETSTSFLNDFDEVSQLIKDRCSIWRAHGTEESVKGPADLSLLWAAVLKPGNLIFWMLSHIYSSKTLVRDIRLEISPYVAASQPPNIFGISEPPRLKINSVDSLSDACPLLKAVFYESLRLYSRPLSVRKVTKNIPVAHTCSNDLPNTTFDRFEIETGAYLVAPLGLQDLDCITHDFDDSFDSNRFLLVDKEGKQRCNDAAARPWGLGDAACPGRTFAEKQVLVFVAAIVSLWDMEPKTFGNWKIPKPGAGHVMDGPAKDCRVLLRSRKLTPTSDG